MKFICRTFSTEVIFFNLLQLPVGPRGPPGLKGEKGDFVVVSKVKSENNSQSLGI